MWGYKLTGYSADEIVGRNCRFLQGAKTDPKQVTKIRDAIEKGRDVSVCLLNYKKDGTPFWNHFFVAPLLNKDNQVVNFVGVQCEVSAVRSLTCCARAFADRRVRLCAVGSGCE